MLKQNSDQRFSSALKRYGVRALWYVTHINNLPSILQYGILCRNEVLKQKLDFKDISDPSVQRWRRWTHNYVPLFLVDNTPMLYVCCQKYPNEIILLEIDLTIADTKGVRFSDGNIASCETKVYENPRDLVNLDWKIILDRRGAFGKEWKRKRSAELLVPQRVPQEFVRCIHFARLGQEKQNVWKITFVSDLTPEGVS